MEMDFLRRQLGIRRKEKFRNKMIEEIPDFCKTVEENIYIKKTFEIVWSCAMKKTD